MSELEQYWKRVLDFPGIVRRPEDAKLDALVDAGGRVLVEQQTEYQRVLLFETPKGETMLLLDGELQFYSADEHRYHEALVIVPFLFRQAPVRRVGVMGGGDGLVARELLRHFTDEIELIRIIDIDPAVTEMARTQPKLLQLNEGSLLDERVEVINVDAASYRSADPFDLILADLPDPTSPVLARLYNREFYEHLRAQLSPEDGVAGVQIVFVPPVFDGVLSTLRAVFPTVREYALCMYSFVRSGFALCGQRPLERCRELPKGTRYLTPEVLDMLFYFAPDEPRVEVDEVSTNENARVTEWYRSFLCDYVEERILYY